MSLATRCSACGTVFRVVQDQLRMSNGWVRCGRCGQVFNAVEGLVDVQAGEPVGEPAPAGAAAPEAAAPTTDAAVADVSPASAAAQEAGAGDAAAAVGGDDAASVDDGAVGAVGADGADGADEAAAADEADAADGVAAPQAPALDEAASPAAVIVAAAAPPQASIAANPPPSRRRRARASSPMPPGEPGGAKPRFLRDAERSARWRQPGVRAALGLASLALLALLAGQVALAQHDWLAARWPALRPALTALCENAGCRIEPLRRIERLSVESSSLVRVGPPGVYRLTVVLRNRDGLPLKMPALDLLLTDAQGTTIARRVIGAAALGADADTLAAGAEAALAGVLRVQGAPLVGYTIEIFYP